MSDGKGEAWCLRKRSGEMNLKMLDFDGNSTWSFSVSFAYQNQ
jgi:hypothetical protein